MTYSRMIIGIRESGEVAAAGWNCAETRTEAIQWLAHGLVLEIASAEQVEAIPADAHVFSSTSPIGQVLTYAQSLSMLSGYLGQASVSRPAGTHRLLDDYKRERRLFWSSHLPVTGIPCLAGIWAIAYVCSLVPGFRFLFDLEWWVAASLHSAAALIALGLILYPSKPCHEAARDGGAQYRGPATNAAHTD